MISVILELFIKGKNFLRERIKNGVIKKENR